MKYEKMYAMNKEPCMIFEVQTAKGWLCLDATRWFGTTGRLMNHAAAREATVKLFKPLLVSDKDGSEKWRVAFLATRDIAEGEELTWDYGCRSEGQEWLMRFPESQQHRVCLK